jgi:hypothetical protein
MMEEEEVAVEGVPDGDGGFSGAMGAFGRELPWYWTVFCIRHKAQLARQQDFNLNKKGESSQIRLFNNQAGIFNSRVFPDTRPPE